MKNVSIETKTVNFHLKERRSHISVEFMMNGFVLFYGISTVVGYLMPDPLRTHISNIYDSWSFGWAVRHSCRMGDQNQ